MDLNLCMWHWRECLWRKMNKHTMPNCPTEINTRSVIWWGECQNKCVKVVHNKQGRLSAKSRERAGRGVVETMMVMPTGPLCVRLSCSTKRPKSSHLEWHVQEVCLSWAQNLKQTGWFFSNFKETKKIWTGKLSFLRNLTAELFLQTNSSQKIEVITKSHWLQHNCSLVRFLWQN